MDVLCKIQSFPWSQAKPDLKGPDLKNELRELWWLGVKKEWQITKNITAVVVTRTRQTAPEEHVPRGGEEDLSGQG